jgi:glycine/D-amino acid oxidase-like deaminating enzyme
VFGAAARIHEVLGVARYLDAPEFVEYPPNRPVVGGSGSDGDNRMRVAVLGAGLQGACLAMELASHHIEVDLYDRNDACMSQASAHNEGKIHLGYVYAQDRTMNTARLMARGAVSFAPLLRSWIGSDVDLIPVSSPFYYAVHRDSLLDIEEVEHHLHACRALIRNEHRGATDYFGQDYLSPPARLKHLEDWFDSSTIQVAFATPEVSLDPEALAQRVRARLSDTPKVRCLRKSRVVGVVPADTSAEVEFEVSDQLRSCTFLCQTGEIHTGAIGPG